VATRDEQTRTVRTLYEQFPFPNTDYKVPAWGFARYFAAQARHGGRSLLAEGVSVLDAGCGTAEFTRSLAASFSQSRFLGVDMTEASLEIARTRAREAGLTNAELQRGNLLELDLGRRFDVVICMGVLHHLADPARGLARLREHLADDGYMVLWLYGGHGRYRLALNQQMIALLAREGEDWRARVDVARRVLTGFAPEHLACHFSVADKAIEDDFPRALAWVLQHDQWIADQFVHPTEHCVTMDNLLPALERSDLHLDAWIGVDEAPERITPDPALQARLAGLSRTDRLRFIDLLLKPNYYLVVARPGRATGAT
jgi:SAM-dependent methyltransferase